MELVGIVVALALLEYVLFAMNAGQARGRYNVPAPATSGHPIFERYLRVQENTLEQLVIFLPALFLFATYVNAPLAALIGLLFIAGRALYARGYVEDPAKRGPGFGLSFIANLVLLVGGLIGAIVAWI